MKARKLWSKGITAAMVAAMVLGSGQFVYAGEGETVELEFFNMKTEIVSILDELISEYEADNPNIKIEVVTPTDASTVLSTRMASNDTPDIFTVWPKESFFEQVDSGYVMDLSDTGIMDNISEDARKQWGYNDGEYVATISYNFGGIWYNKDIFAECGIENFPTTWDEMLDACSKLKDAGYTPFVIGGQKTDQTVQQCYLSIGSCFTEDEYNTFLEDMQNRAVDASSEVYGEALKTLGQKLSDIGTNSQDDILGSDDSAAVMDFATGKSAMMIDGSWKLPAIKDANPDMNCALEAIPAADSAETKIAAYPGDFSLCLSSSLEGEKKDAAIDFLKWMTSTETASKYAEKDGSPSCIQGVEYVAEAFSDVYNAYITTGKFILNPDCKRNSAQITAVGSATQQIYYDNDVDAFTQNMQSALNDN